MSRNRRRVLGLLVISMVLNACAGGPQPIRSEDHTIFVHARTLLPQGGEGAGIEGLLAVRDGCVVLESEDAELWYPVVWPAGTSIASDDPFILRLPSGEELALGEKVTGGGGFHSPSMVDVGVPPDCLSETQEIAVFNPNDDPSVVGP